MTEESIPANGGRVWEAPENDSKEANLSVPVIIITATFLAGWAALGVATSFILGAEVGSLPFILWVAISFIFFLMTSYRETKKHSLSRAQRKIFRMIYVSLLGMLLALMFSVSSFKPFTAPENIPGMAWIETKVAELTKSSDYVVDKVKTYPADKTRATAVIENDENIKFMELQYVDGEWEAAVK